MSKIFCLVGMIASGKSSYCKNAAKAGQIIVNDDAIVNMIHADDYTLYDKNLKLLYKSIENHIIATALSMGKSVVVDRGLNVSENGRKRWVALAQSFDVFCEAIVFKNEGVEAHANRRANSDARGHDYNYWMMVASHHQTVYKHPAFCEGFSKIHDLSFVEIQQGTVID